MNPTNSIEAWITPPKNPTRTSIRELALANKALLDLDEIDLTLICLEGELWLTRDRDPEDHIIECGQRFAIKAGDKAVVHALRNSRIRLIRFSPARSGRPGLISRAAQALAQLGGLAT